MEAVRGKGGEGRKKKVKCGRERLKETNNHQLREEIQILKKRKE